MSSGAATSQPPSASRVLPCPDGTPFVPGSGRRNCQNISVKTAKGAAEGALTMSGKHLIF